MSNPFTTRISPVNAEKDARRPVSEGRTGNMAKDGYTVLRSAAREPTEGPPFGDLRPYEPPALQPWPDYDDA